MIIYPVLFIINWPGKKNGGGKKKYKANTLKAIQHIEKLISNEFKERKPFMMGKL